MRKAKKPRRQPDSRRLRMRVFEALATPENKPDAAIADMQLYIDWIRTGRTPRKASGRPHLEVVRDPVDRGQ